MVANLVRVPRKRTLPARAPRALLPEPRSTGRACRLTASIKQHMRSCDLTLGFARCQCVAFGNSFTTSFVEEIKDRGAPPHGLSESMLVWFMGGGNKRDEIDISVNLSDAEVQQAGQARVLYSDSHSTGTDLTEFLKFGSRRSGA